MLAWLALVVLQSSPEPTVIPRPQEMAVAEGAPFVLKKGAVVLTRDASPALRSLTSLMSLCTGEVPTIVRTRVGAGGAPTVSARRVRDLPEEGYRLNVDERELAIQFGGDAGLFYAVQTLRQLLPDAVDAVYRDPSTVWTVPAVQITDAPRFSWRGLHLDVSRHFFPVESIKRYIDFIALHKMNVFHWHLIDDGGWRMQVRKYPLLTAVGGWRAGGPGEWSYSDIRFLFDSDERPRYGGSYTQDEIREVVRYAAERYVTVVPEIELPGHTTPSIVVYPDLACEGVPPPRQRGRTESNVYCPGKEGTFAFLEDVLTETLELFPSKWIHIGGDEVDKSHWSRCPQCRQRMATEGLKNVDELQSYFVKRIERFLVANGRRLVGWDEILEGGLAPQATVMSWRGEEGGIAAAKAGHDVVMSPTSHCYFDYAYSSIPTRHVYDWEPVPAALTADEGKRVLGGQANVWTEWIPTFARVEEMVFPRGLATAEVLWTGKERRDWDSFTRRLERYYHRLDAMEVQYYVPAPEVAYTAAVFRDSESVAAVVPASSPFSLRYTTDGSVPTVNAREYVGPITVTTSQVVSFAFVTRTGRVGESSRVECVKTVPLSGRGLTAGWTAEFYEGKWERVPDFESVEPRKRAEVATVGLEQRTRDEEFAVRFSGFIQVTKAGVYRFRLGSDDGSYFVVAGARVVDNDGLHGYVEREGSVRLEPGLYPVVLGYFEQGGAERLTFAVKTEDGDWGAPPVGMFMRPA